MRTRLLVLPVVLSAGVACGGTAQEPLPLGAEAPPFSLTGATREGILPAPVSLADLRDKAVVIAFFYKARTKG
ncbi:MAG TPA: hypothetical protein VFV65_04940 [Gemmatimonadales bacterium]|nr:hypothetical protein [Gemmatimonadales bacterium]